MFSIGLTSTVAFPLVAFQGTLPHGSEVSALATVTLAMTLSHVYEYILRQIFYVEGRVHPPTSLTPTMPPTMQ